MTDLAILSDDPSYVEWSGDVCEILCEHLDITWSDAIGLCDSRMSVMKSCFRDGITPATTAITFISNCAADK